MIRALAGSRLLRLFSSAVLDQALLSATNFLVGLLLIRYSSDADYGQYVLAFNGLLLLTSFQGALIGGPLMVLAPKKSPEEQRAMVAELYRRVMGFCLRATPILLLLLPIVAWLAGQTLEFALLVAAFIVAAHAAIEREYLRSALMIYARPNAVLAADTVYALVLAATALLAILLVRPAAPAAVLGIAVASWIGARVAHASFGKQPGWSTQPAPLALSQVLPLGYWAAAGSLIYWLFYQGYSYLAAIKLDVAAVAALAATRLLLMPVNLLATGVRQVLMPTAVGWYRDYGIWQLVRRIFIVSLGVLLLMAIYDAALWLLRDWIIDSVLQKDIADRNLLLGLWILIFSLAVVRDQVMMVFLIRERFRAMTQLTAACAVVSLLSSWFAMGQYGVVGALYGLAFGELVNLLGVLVLTTLQVRADLQREAHGRSA